VHVMVVRDLHIGNKEFDSVELGDRIRVEIKKSRFQINDPHILSIGQFLTRIGEVAPTAAATAAATAATATAAADAGAELEDEVAAAAEEAVEEVESEEEQEQEGSNAFAEPPPTDEVISL
jgi:hypothetical protein